MQKKQIVQRLNISGIDQTMLLGQNDRYLKKISAALDTQITVRGSEVIIQGDYKLVQKAEKIFTEIIILSERNNQINESDVTAIIGIVCRNQGELEEFHRAENGNWPPVIYTKDSAIRPRTQAQADYVKTAANNDLTFVIGPAGTGKTYLAVAMAVAQFRDKQVSRIVLTRPAVEAGESLGYLPGDLLEKVDPYLRPLYDALADILQAEKMHKYFDTKIVEVVPLAYMRGRTINDAFVILDEAQNTTSRQMKMFLTRLGMNSKAIVTGDITQIDLASGVESGLVQVKSILADIPGIAFVYLNENDVVRHRLVREIIKAYNNSDESA